MVWLQQPFWWVRGLVLIVAREMARRGIRDGGMERLWGSRRIEEMVCRKLTLTERRWIFVSNGLIVVGKLQ